MSDENDRKVCVILPICDDKSLRTSDSRNLNPIDQNINFESSIESTCISKPLIVFTIKALKRISCIDTIILSSTSSRQEQIQDIISEFLPNYEGLKYLCAQNILSKNGQKNNNSSNLHDITLNRLLKHCCSFLNETNDLIIIHDPNMPCIDEKIINDLCFEAFIHGAACLSTTENIKNLLVKIEDRNIDEEEAELSINSSINHEKVNRSFSTSGALVSDYLDFNYRICLKPQAFKYSIFLIIFDNCSKQELDNDVDCLKLAKIHADIRPKLVFEKNVTNYPKNICCIQRYLKQVHKQAILIKKNIDRDVCFLQNILRNHKWNIEVSSNFDRENFLKIHEMVDAIAITNGVVLIKFCDDLNDIKNFEFTFDSNQVEGEAHNDIKKNNSPNDDRESPKSLKSLQNLSNYVLFMIKMDSISCPVNTTAQDAIRYELKQNMNVSKIWHITVLYETMNLIIGDMINYLLTDRNQSINGQIFECREN